MLEDPSQRFVARLRSKNPVVAVELRPPRSGLAGSGAMDLWIDMSHTIRGLSARDAFLLLTDSALGEEEEENLQHLTSNIADEGDPWRVVPFLTCLHPLEYCLRYGDRARMYGIGALTVTGGDASASIDRCVPHGYQLRGMLAEKVPGLSLGGWINVHRSLEQQLEYALSSTFGADYFLSQIVSHYDLDRVERWLNLCAGEGLEIPGAYGVFFYRNGRRPLLEYLRRFFAVPVDDVAAAFESGVRPESHCAQTIAGLRKLGIDNTYVCNLGSRYAARYYDRIMNEVASLE